MWWEEKDTMTQLRDRGGGTRLRNIYTHAHLASKQVWGSLEYKTGGWNKRTQQLAINLHWKITWHLFLPLLVQMEEEDQEDAEGGLGEWGGVVAMAKGCKKGWWPQLQGLLGTARSLLVVVVAGLRLQASLPASRRINPSVLCVDCYLLLTIPVASLAFLLSPE